MLIHWPVVHLQRGIAPVPGESDQVVFAIVYRRGRLLDADVHRPDVERHTYFALLLETTRREEEHKKSQGLNESKSMNTELNWTGVERRESSSNQSRLSKQDKFENLNCHRAKIQPIVVQYLINYTIN